MYRVNTEKINEILTYITKQVLPAMRRAFAVSRETFLNDDTAGFAAERLFHVFIEGMTDVGNLLIDGFIMRDPGGYDDIVDIMEDERVYTPEQARVFKRIILLRKEIVREYIRIDRGQLYDVYHESSSIIEKYPRVIQDYLEKELW